MRILKLEGSSVCTIALDQDVQQHPRSVKIIRHHHHWKEKDEVRISAASAVGHMLYQIKEFKPGSSLRKEINSFLIPLLLSIQDRSTDVVKACGWALTEWAEVMGWLPLISVFQESNLSDPIYVLEETCKYLVNTQKMQFLGDLLLQSFEFLRSTQPFLRAAALVFIASITLKINLKDIREDDVQLLQNTVESMRNDPLRNIEDAVSIILTCCKDRGKRG